MNISQLIEEKAKKEQSAWFHKNEVESLIKQTLYSLLQKQETVDVNYFIHKKVVTVDHIQALLKS